MLKITLVYLLFFIFSYIVFRYIVRKDYLSKGRLSITSAFMEVLVFAVHANLSYLHLPANWPSFPAISNRVMLNTAGFVLIIMGLIGVFTGMAKLGFDATMGEQKNQFQKEGLYRWSRNPQLLFYFILLAGYVILWPSWEALVWLGVYGIAAHLMVMTEEEHLLNRFGAEYVQYCQEVPRYLGLPTRRKLLS